MVRRSRLGLIALADTFSACAVAAAFLGVGTAMVYPTLLAAIGDVAPGGPAPSVSTGCGVTAASPSGLLA